MPNVALVAFAHSFNLFRLQVTRFDSRQKYLDSEPFEIKNSCSFPNGVGKKHNLSPATTLTPILAPSRLQWVPKFGSSQFSFVFTNWPAHTRHREETFCFLFMLSTFPNHLNHIIYILRPSLEETHVQQWHVYWYDIKY